MLLFSFYIYRNLSALAPQPVVTGYSLVGVYPCAVWKPSPHNSDEIVANCFCNNHGPIRSNRLASTVRTTPYPPVQLYNSNSSIIETCRCRTVTEDLVSSAESAVNTPTSPMLFVPFTLQTNFGAHHLAPGSGNAPLNITTANNVCSSAVTVQPTKVIFIWISQYSVVHSRKTNNNENQ